MSIDACIAEITKAVGRELTDTEKKAVHKQVKSVLERAKRVERLGGTEQAAQEIMRADLDALQRDILIAKRQAALNTTAKINANDYIRTAWGDNPADGLKALYQGVLADRPGSRDSIGHLAETMSQAKVAALATELQLNDLTDAAKSGHFDLEARKYAAAKDANGDTSKFSATSKALADIYRKHQEVLRTERNNAGSWTGQLPGYISSQSHNMHNIASAGWEKWRDTMFRLLDWEKSFNGTDIKDRDAVLRTMYEEFSSGLHMNWKDNSPRGAGKGFANIGKRSSHERVLQFKGPEAEQEYFEAFGIGNSLYESVASTLQRGGRDLAIMRKMGPNAEANINELVTNWSKDLLKEGRGDEARKLMDTHKRLQDTTWKVISGAAGTSSSHALAQVGETFSNLQRMADLGGIAISSVGDISNAASVANYFGERKLSNYFGQVGRSAKYFVKTLGVGTARDERALAAEAGIMLEGLHNPISATMTDSPIPGMVAKSTARIMQITGLYRAMNGIKTASFLGTGSHLGLHSDLPLSKLPAGTQTLMRSFGVSPEEWDLARQAPMRDFRGTKILNAETIAEMPDEDFADRRAKTALVDKFRNMQVTVANMAVTSSSAADRALISQGYNPGTPAGFALRQVSLFRSYTLSWMRNHLGRELHGYHPDRVGTAQALARMVTNPTSGQLAGLTTLMAGSLFAGHVQSVLADVAQGKEPIIIPADVVQAGVAFKNAFTRSGALGLYGDVVTGQINDQTSGADYWASLMGPSVRRFTKLTETGLDLVRGDYDKAAKKAAKFTRDLVPLRNLAYTRWATDYLLVHEINEFLDPGYLDRAEQRLQEEKGQQYFVPPSSVIPYGGQ